MVAGRIEKGPRELLVPNVEIVPSREVNFSFGCPTVNSKAAFANLPSWISASVSPES